MAQAQIETCFGKAGAGRECSRRSIFGVAKKSYSNYKDAVDSYISILKKYYLVNGKTEKDLLNRYVTKSGARYASSTSYEGKLKKCYNGIVSSTKIKDLQTKYRKLK